MEKCTRIIGLDESKATIQVAVAENTPRGEVREYGAIPNTAEALAKLVRRLGRPKDLFFVYEAGPCGYTTYRTLRALGANCVVVAPSRTPQRPGDRIKNDRRDAVNLARLYRAGELTTVWVPDEETEAMRDLTRAREDAKYAETRARQRLQSFLLRHGRRYPGRTAWGNAHARWLAEQRFAHPGQHVAFEEYCEAVREATRRVERLDQQVHDLLPTWSMAPIVQALTAHRGVSQVVGSTFVAELGDITRSAAAYGAPEPPSARSAEGGAGDRLEGPGPALRPLPAAASARQAAQRHHHLHRTGAGRVLVGHGAVGQPAGDGHDSLKRKDGRLRTAGHRGHGTGRTLVRAKCNGREPVTHASRPSQLPDGTMTGGNQPTHIRGINRRRKVPMTRCPEAPDSQDLHRHLGGS